MRKIDRILLAVVFIAVFWRLADQTLFSVQPDTLRTPLVIHTTLDVARQNIPAVLKDSPIAPSTNKPNSYYTGSAFALSRDGHWMTATHVADNCKRIEILHETGKARFKHIPVKGWRKLEGLDIAILDTAKGQPGLNVARTLSERGDLGFFFGYPKGVASAGYAAHLGRSRMIRAGGRVRETGDVWSIYEMAPRKEIHLGGNSGGPMMNAVGEVVGVVSAGSDRRGRVITSIVPGLTPVKSFSKPEHQRRAKLTPSNYIAYGEQLRRQGLVTKVSCRT